MQAFHIPGAAPLYTNTFLLISDAGHEQEGIGMPWSLIRRQMRRPTIKF